MAAAAAPRPRRPIRLERIRAVNACKAGADLAYGQFVYASDNTDYAQRERWREAAGTPRAADWQPAPLESLRGGAKVLALDCVGVAAFAGTARF